MKSLRCIIGIHKWEYYGEDLCVDRQCVRCGTGMHRTYDMAYGCTYWEDGRWDTAARRLQEGWEDYLEGRTEPIEKLWEDVE